MANQNNNKMILTIAVIAIVVVALGYAFINSSKKEVAVKAPTPTNTPAATTTSANTTADTQQMPMAPDFTLMDLQSKPVKLSDYRGKVVFVNFWATWCPPCRREIPSFIKLIDKYGKDGFIVLGIAVDSREFDKVAPFAKKLGMNYPVLYDSKGVSNLYGGIQSIPTTFVVNREGKVVYRIVGSRPADTFEEIITSLL